MAYKEINPTIWKYEKDGDFIEGTLARIQSEVGSNKSMLYSIENADGVKDVWGAAILDERMAFAKVGQKIKITFKGKAVAKPGKQAAKIFKVEIDDGL